MFGANMTVVLCYKCGIEFHVPTKWQENRAEDQEDFWCPNGHRQHYCESSLDKLRRERDRLKQHMAQMEDEVASWTEIAEHQERRAAAYKGHLTKTKKRIKHGICPCCNRHFDNLERHMASKHPDFQPEAKVPEDDKVVQMPERRKTA